MWVDADEFVYHPRMPECLAWHRDEGHAVGADGRKYNMMSAELPAERRSQPAHRRLPHWSPRARLQQARDFQSPIA